MSGERIVLTGDAHGTAARLVQAVARLAGLDLGPYALVGGLAVMCRLAAVHRVTHDVDTVVESTAPSAVEVIASMAGAVNESNHNRVVVEGVKVDVIDTASLRHEDLVGLDVADQLFVVSHRWALDTATETELVAGPANASIRVATSAALVAMKSGAVLGGRLREPSKMASDLFDLYRLAVEYERTGAISDALASAPLGLGPLVAYGLRTVVLDQPERAVRRLLAGGPEIAAVTAGDLVDVLGPLADQLSS